MSDTLTPRTDAIAGWIAVTPGRIHDLTNLSRTLERELSEWHRIAGEQIERLTRERDAFAERWRKTDEEVERLKALLREGMHPFDNQDAWLNYNKRIRAALGGENNG